MINGLHNLDIEPFCRLLEEKLKKEGGWESIINFSLPPKRNLPQLRSVDGHLGDYDDCFYIALFISRLNALACDHIDDDYDELMLNVLRCHLTY